MWQLNYLKNLFGIGLPTDFKELLQNRAQIILPPQCPLQRNPFGTKSETLRGSNSMCERVYQNSNAERINGTIKNDYLIHYHPQSFQELNAMLNKAVEMYNRQRPHASLKKLTPAEYENLFTENYVVHKRKKEPKKEKDNNCNNKFTLSLKTVNLIQA